MRSPIINLRRFLLACSALLICAPALAANYPLELVSPRAAGSAPSADAGTPAMPAGHRIFSAHPGVTYNIRAVVIAGAYPYQFSLSNAPTGMTIDSVTGEINWVNPQAAATPTITVTDAEGTSRSSPWTINVTTAGFRFVDSARGSDANAGTLAAPWQTLAKVKQSSVAGDLIYFRTGTYTTVGMATDGTGSDFVPAGNWRGVGFEQPIRWMAFPGETPIYDAGYIAGQRQGNILKVQGSDRYPLYLEGFRIQNIYHMGIQFGSGSCDYPVFRNLAMNGPAMGIDGQNSSGIMTMSSLEDPTWYAAYQNMSQVNGAAGMIKQYSHKKNLWEDCRISNGFGGADQKMHVPRFEVRNCVITAMTAVEQGGLFGNMQYGSGGVGETSSGEFRFNLVDRRNISPTAVAIDMNQNADSGQMFVYRNTFLGRVRVRNADGADGPFRIYNNVIVNTDPGTHIYLEDVDTPSRIVALDNLTGTASNGLVDSTGNLTGTNTRFIGTRGHMIGPAGPQPSPPAAAVQ